MTVTQPEEILPSGPAGSVPLEAALPGEAALQAPALETPAEQAPAEQPVVPPVTEVHPQAEDPVIILPPGTAQARLVVQVAEGERVQMVVEAHRLDGTLFDRRPIVIGEAVNGPAVWLPRLIEWARARSDTNLAALSAWLTGLALGVYLLVRLIALPAFPIYFFTDEAIQTVSAADLLRDHFYSHTHELLPTYFENGSQYNLSASIYLQVLPYFLFGKSIWATRGVSVMMTLIAAWSVGMILKRVFHSPYPWLAVLFLSITPAWFLHSRTAFETALATSFYAGFLYCYLLYRTEDPRYLFGAIGFGALAFYSYSPMRMILLVTGLLLFLSDLKYHLAHWRALVLGLSMMILLALPLLRFLIYHPEASDWQMRLLGSYWIYDVPLSQKLTTFLGEYLRGLDPLYWFLPNNIDLPRHRLLGYGQLLRQTLPLGLLGGLLALRRIRVPAYRTLILAVLAAPSGAALVRLGITRVLVMVIPVAILTALAAGWLLDWLHRRGLSRALLSVLVFAVLAGANVYMLWDALNNGPLWFKDYGLNGMQYGAQQIFGEVKDYLKAHPDTRVILSPSWANGTDVLARFFFSDPLPFELGSADPFFESVQPLSNTVFIMIPEEYNRIPRSRFAEVTVEKTINYPDGRPGFYFVRLKYQDNIAAIIAQEEQARKRPLNTLVRIDGQDVPVTYTRLDIGAIGDLFSNAPNVLLRTEAINPMQLTFDFPSPRPIKGLTLRVGGASTSVQLFAFREDQVEPLVMSQVLAEAPNPRDVSFDFQDELQVTRLQIEIKNLNDPPNGHVHLWKLEFH